MGLIPEATQGLEKVFTVLTFPFLILFPFPISLQSSVLPKSI